MAFVGCMLRAVVLQLVLGAAVRHPTQSMVLMVDSAVVPAGTTLSDYCKRDPKVEEGEHVTADWKHYGTFYPGVITKIHKDGTYDVKYEDGWTEKDIVKNDIHILEDKEQTPRDDAACELANKVQTVKKDIKKVHGNLANWNTGLRAKDGG